MTKMCKILDLYKRRQGKKFKKEYRTGETKENKKSKMIKFNSMYQ